MESSFLTSPFLLQFSMPPQCRFWGTAPSSKSVREMLVCCGMCEEIIKFYPTLCLRKSAVVSNLLCCRLYFPLSQHPLPLFLSLFLCTDIISFYQGDGMLPPWQVARICSLYCNNRLLWQNTLLYFGVSIGRGDKFVIYGSAMRRILFSTGIGFKKVPWAH